MAEPRVAMQMRFPVSLYNRLVIEKARTGESHNAIVVRALESALRNSPKTEDTHPSGASAQTRTSEESSRSSSDGSGSNPPPVAGSAKESAPPGPARAATEDGDARPVKPSSGRGPRRSEDVKRNVRPIKR